jgi:GGDEF domain-containing protein
MPPPRPDPRSLPSLPAAPEKLPAAHESLPQTRSDLQSWVHSHLKLAPADEAALFTAIDVVFSRHERLWQESKQEAVQALASGFAERMSGLKTELSAKDATVSSISRYFESLVANLTDRSHRDPKTKLMNFARFVEQLESFLALEQRGKWLGVGLVDITGFKWYNDALGHQVGDRIIKSVAEILQKQVRSDDVLAQDGMGGYRSPDLHARFGGDEFCFMIPDLNHFSEAWMIAERFREAVERHDWTSEDSRLVVQPPRVDVGIVCLLLGKVAARRPIAKKLAERLITRADKLMYDAKGERANHVFPLRVRIEDGDLVELGRDESESESE